MTKKSTPTRWWLWPQMLSLEAPCIAVLWMAALAHTHRFRLPFTFYWGLFLATWIVYILDRLGDATSSNNAQPLTERHAFHLRYRRLLLWGILPVCLSFLVWAALCEIPESLAVQGLGLLLFGAIYLASYSAALQSRSRQLMLGVAFASGMLLLFHLDIALIFRVAAATIFGIFIIAAAKRGGDERWRIALPKEILASLLFILGTSAGVHFWCTAEHGILCFETLLLWGITALNMTAISFSETLHGMPAAQGSIANTNPKVARLLPFLLIGLAAVSGISLVQSFSGHASPYIAGTSAMVLASSLAQLTLQSVTHRIAPATFRALADLALFSSAPLAWVACA